MNQFQHGARPPLPKGPASLIMEPFREWIVATVLSYWNQALKIKYLAADGKSTIVTDAKFEMTKNGLVAILDLATGSTPLRSASSGPVGFMYFKGLWLAGTSAQPSEVWILQSGTATGTYICTTVNNTNSPDTGTGWIQIGTLQGQWL